MEYYFLDVFTEENITTANCTVDAIECVYDTAKVHISRSYNNLTELLLQKYLDEYCHCITYFIEFIGFDG